MQKMNLLHGPVQAQINSRLEVLVKFLKGLLPQHPDDGSQAICYLRQRKGLCNQEQKN